MVELDTWCILKRIEPVVAEGNDAYSLLRIQVYFHVGERVWVRGYLIVVVEGVNVISNCWEGLVFVGSSSVISWARCVQERDRVFSCSEVQKQSCASCEMVFCWTAALWKWNWLRHSGSVYYLVSLIPRLLPYTEGLISRLPPTLRAWERSYSQSVFCNSKPQPVFGTKRV